MGWFYLLPHGLLAIKYNLKGNGRPYWYPRWPQNIYALFGCCFFSQLFFLHNKNRKICKNGSEMMFFIPAIKGNRLIYGGHFDLTFWRSRTQSTAMVEQKMESAYLKYVNRHDYLLVLKMPLEVIFSQNQTSLLSHIDWFPVIDSRFVILLLSMSNNCFWHVRFVSSASLCHYGPA